MTELRRPEFERAVKKKLPESRAQQIRSGNHFGDFHLGVIDHDGELIGRNVVLSPDDKIAKLDFSYGSLRPGALIVKLQCFAFRNTETPVRARRVPRFRDR